MHPEHAHKLCNDFDLGSYQASSEIVEGALNRNYVLTTDSGSYFVKSVRERRKLDIPYIAAVEEFMADRGIPAVCMLTNKEVRNFVQYEDEVYTVYPFLENHFPEKFSDEEYFVMGELLGSIHKIGAGTLTGLLTTKVFKEHNWFGINDKLSHFKEEIEKSGSKSDVDQLFLAYIVEKQRLMSALPEPQVLTSDTLIHGDFHARNLLFSDSRKVVGVVDWEKSEIAPRSYELARSMQYICFDTKADVSDAIRNGKIFLKGYKSIYPISDTEIKAGFVIRLTRLAYSKWIEEQYYERGDNRSNKFIPNEIRLLNLFSKQEFIEELLG